MLKHLTGTLIGIGLTGAVILGIIYLLASIFHWSLVFPSPKLMLDVVAGIICLIWLLFILKVPWDLYFETGSVLFEMKRSLELQVAVNPERMRYVRRMRSITGLIAIGSHLASAAIIAGLTYWAHGQIGYYFAFFYIVATFFRPTSRAYYFFLEKLREIRNEVKYPREDVVKLRHDLAQAVEHMRSLEEGLRRANSRIGATEEAGRAVHAEISDIRFALQRAEQSFQSRIQCLSGEVERSLMKAFDQQDIVNGLRAFAKLVKQA